MLLKCDGKCGCSKEFRIETFEVEKLDRDIEKTYFSCPHCSKEYISFYTDKYIRKKQELIRGITSESALNRLKKEIGKDMKNLKKKIDASVK